MSFELRIHRTFSWAAAPYSPGEPVTYGGPPRPLYAKPTDALQFRQDGGDWQDVPVVEAEKPPKPDQRRRW